MVLTMAPQYPTSHLVTDSERVTVTAMGMLDVYHITWMFQCMTKLYGYDRMTMV